MQKIKAIIVDDEMRAQNLLKNMLKEFCPDIEVLDSCIDLPNAVKSIRKVKPDIVFLDIEMPGHSGLELIEFFDKDEIEFEIIFTTAYNQYSINAIKLEAFDYLLKPIEPEELINTIDRFRSKYFNSTKLNDVSLSSSKIGIPTGNGMRFINTDEIVYLKADNTYTEVYLLNDEKIVVSRTLKNFEDALKDVSHFFRCNKSYIINHHFVTEYVKSDGGYVIMINKATVPISPGRSEDLLNAVKLIKR